MQGYDASANGCPVRDLWIEQRGRNRKEGLDPPALQHSLR